MSEHVMEIKTLPAVRRRESPAGLSVRFVKYLYTHNPFYVISAVMVLYGVHRAFGGQEMLEHRWLLLQVLGGYTLAMAAAAVLVVRLGQVWDDARMMLLLLVLLFGAISMSFDLVSLQDPRAGRELLACGFLFSILVTEGTLRALRMRLSWLLRIPFYLQLALLFGYPMWLADLSFRGEAASMSRFVMLFPVAAGLCLLSLWPAAYRDARDARPTGTPWPRPWYPWTMFFFVGVGFALRSYSLTVTFEDTGGLASGFQGYFLIPLLLAACVLFYEMAVQHEWPVIRGLTLFAPVALLALAFPQGPRNVAQARFLAIMAQYELSPATLLLAAAALFYAWIWWRGEAAAERGLVFSLLALSFLRPSFGTAALAATPLAAPLLLLLGVELVYGLRRGSTWRILAVLAVGAIGSVERLQETFWADYRGLVPAALYLYATLLAGLLFDDGLARSIRRHAARIIPLAVVGMALALPWLFQENVFVVSSLTTLGVVVALLYWYSELRLRDLANLLAAVSGAILAWAEWSLLGWTASFDKGEGWIAAGGGSLLIGLCISLAKGGGTSRTLVLLNRLNRRVHGRRARRW